MKYTKHITHEAFIQTVRDLAVEYASNVHARVHANGHTATPALDAQQLASVARAKLLYGRGHHFGVRGLTQYGAWVNGERPDELIEVCAVSEESWVQLAGTTIHELAHVATGMGNGHNKAWRQACEALGLRHFRLHGSYQLANFAPELRMKLAMQAKPADGMPALAASLLAGLVAGFKARPCAAGVGTRGGKSRGPGSGSRLRKYVCDGQVWRPSSEGGNPATDGEFVPHGQIIRASTDNLDATCNVCGGKFILEG